MEFFLGIVGIVCYCVLAGDVITALHQLNRLIISQNPVAPEPAILLTEPDVLHNSDFVGFRDIVFMINNYRAALESINKLINGFFLEQANAKIILDQTSL